MSDPLPPEIDLILSLIHDERKKSEREVRRLEKVLVRTSAAEVRWREVNGSGDNCPYQVKMIRDNLNFAIKRLDLADSAWKKASEVFGVPEWSIKG